MSDHFNFSIKSAMAEKCTDDLLSMWVNNDRLEWSDEAFDAIKQILRERGVHVPEQPPPLSTDDRSQSRKLGTKRITIDESWIDRQITLLTLNLGVIRPKEGSEYVFNPTPGFYGFISQGNIDALNEAMGILANHLGYRYRPIVEPWTGQADPLSTFDQNWIDAEKAEAPGLIRFSGSNHGRISISTLNKHSPHLVGAIMAHELTHHFLFSNKISYPDNRENERLTDFAAVFLGFGKLILNGYIPETRISTTHKGRGFYQYQLGYLSEEEVAMIFWKLCNLRGITIDDIEGNLSVYAHQLMLRSKSMLETTNERAREWREEKENKSRQSTQRGFLSRLMRW